MSGGFFRGTSADQDTRFSNKTAKLLKTQKFAPELDQLIDMSKVHLDSMRPWIANRVTQLLGFEDEVLINFIYGLLEGKNVDGKQIQIQLTGFMEKNTGKFMKELWGLLTSAQNSTTGIPQQLLEEKAEEARLKKAEEHRVISEVRRKEDERRALEQEAIKKENEDDRVDLMNSAIPTASKQRSHSPSRGRKSPDGDRAKIRNGALDSRPSRSRSVSKGSSRSVSRSPLPAYKRRMSRRSSPSPPRRSHRSRSPPRRARSPNHRRRSRSPLKRARSPVNMRSPRRRRHSYSRSPRRRSPIPPARSPRRRHSPHYSRSPRGRSPIIRSPRRRYSPLYTRSSPRRRASPSRHRRRSPHPAYSPIRRHHQASSPGRRRYTPPRNPESSPRRRPRVSSPRRPSLSPRAHTRSLSAEPLSKSPLQNRLSSGSPQRRLSSTSPSHQSVQSFSPPGGKSSFVASPHQKSPLPKARPSRDSVSPVKQNKLPYQYHSSQSPSPRSQRRGAESPRRIEHVAPVESRAFSPSLSPPRERRSPSLSDASPGSGKSQSRSPPTATELKREGPLKIDQEDFKMSQQLTMSRKRTRSSSRESSPPEGRKVVPPKKPVVSDTITDGYSPVERHAAKLDESVSRSSKDDRQVSPGRKWRHTKDLESDGNEEHGPTSHASFDDKKAAKRRRKEERRMRKEEKRRKREERHKRKEERRASKALSKGIASVTPPPDFHKSTGRSDGYDSSDEGKVQYDEDTEIEQRKLENELRRKALDSIRAKKGSSS